MSATEPSVLGSPELRSDPDSRMHKSASSRAFLIQKMTHTDPFRSPHPQPIPKWTFDPSIQTSMIFGAILLVVVYLVHKFVLTDPRRKHLPPLVAGPPIINHTFIHLESEFPWRLTQWRDQYGDIFRTKSAATDFIWLSSPKLVKDIIDKRSAIYSSRQPQPMALGAASGGKRMTFMPKGKQWRTLRAIIHRVWNNSFPLVFKMSSWR